MFKLHWPLDNFWICLLLPSLRYIPLERELVYCTIINMTLEKLQKAEERAESCDNSIQESHGRGHTGATKVRAWERRVGEGSEG